MLKTPLAFDGAYILDASGNPPSPSEVIAACNNNALIIAKLKKADSILLQANPHCSPEYLFSQIQLAFGEIRAALAVAGEA